MLKRILINIILIIIFVCAVEIYSFNKTAEENEVFKKQADRLESNGTRKYKTRYSVLKPFNPSLFRNSFIKENDKKPILWFGCSFAEGAGLEDIQTPCYKISSLSGRSCINKAKGATGTQFMYYQLLKDKEDTNEQEPEYIIYTFIWNHLQRLYNYQVSPLIDMQNLRYKIKNGKLEEIKPIFMPVYSSFFIKRLLNKKVSNQTIQEHKDFELFNKIMEESVKITKERNPNSKFIMIEFPENSRKELPQYEIDTLNSYGITVVKVTDLIKDIDIYDKKYWLPDDIHPTVEAWDLFLPELSKRYLN